MNNNLSRFADSKVYFQCPICTKSMDIQGNSLICRHGHCFDISRYGYVNLLLKSSPKTNYSKRSFDNRHQILEYGMYDVVLEKIIQFTKVSHLPFYRLFQMIVSCNLQINNSLTFCKRKLMLYINSLLQHLMVTKQVGLLQAHQQSVYLPSNSPWYQPH